MAFSKNRRLADLVSSAGEVSSFVDASVTHADLHTSMDLTGKTVTVANASTGDSDTTAANTAFVQQEIAALVDSAPGTLNTLNELAAALGDDASFSTTVTNSIATKAPLAGPTFTGDVDIAGSDDLRLRFLNGSTFKGGIQVPTSTGDMISGAAVDDLAIRSQANMLFSAGGNTESMRIASDGAVTLKPNGITTGLRLQGRSSDNHFFLQWNSNDGNTNYGSIGSNNSGRLDYQTNTHRFTNQASNDHYMTINSTGVGIGVDPTTLLHIKGTGDAIRVESTNSGAGGAQLDLLHFSGSPADADTHAMINFGGYYSGTTSAYGSSIKSIWTDVSAREAAMTFTTRNAGNFNEAMRINSTGEVGIGTTPVSHYTGYRALDIGTAMSLFSNSGSTNVSTMTNNGYLNSGASQWTYKVADEATMYSQVHGDHRFSTAVSGSAGNAISWGEKVRIQAAGGISFNGDTAAANALDDYEEGEVAYYGGGAPRWYGSAGAFENTGQLGGNKIYYTKIGNMVHLHGQVSWTNTGSHGGNIRCDLPFPVVNGHRGALALGLIAGLNTGSTGFVTLVTETGSTVAYLLEISSGGGHSHTDAVDLTGNSYRVISFAGSYTTSS